MSSQEGESGIRRILVAVDPSRQSLLALQAAASLVAHLDAEVIGILVEDTNLFRLAEMPFIQEVGHYSARPYPLDSQVLERQLRASNRRLKELVQFFAASTNQRWSLQTSRGLYPSELLASVLDTDLLILVRAGLPGTRRIMPEIRSLIMQAPRQALIVSRPVQPGKQVAILFDGSESSQKALQAGRLVITPENAVIVLIVAPDLEQALRLQARARAGLDVSSRQIRYHWLRGVEAGELAQFTKRAECGVLVLLAESESLSVDSLLAIIERTDCSVLLVH